MRSIFKKIGTRFWALPIYVKAIIVIVVIGLLIAIGNGSVTDLVRHPV